MVASRTPAISRPGECEHRFLGSGSLKMRSPIRSSKRIVNRRRRPALLSARRPPAGRGVFLPSPELVDLPRPGSRRSRYREAGETSFKANDITLVSMGPKEPALRLSSIRVTGNPRRPKNGTASDPIKPRLPVTRTRMSWSREGFYPIRVERPASEDWRLPPSTRKPGSEYASARLAARPDAAFSSDGGATLTGVLGPRSFPSPPSILPPRKEGTCSARFLPVPSMMPPACPVERGRRRLGGHR